MDELISKLSVQDLKEILGGLAFVVCFVVFVIVINKDK